MLPFLVKYHKPILLAVAALILFLLVRKAIDALFEDQGFDTEDEVGDRLKELEKKDPPTYPLSQFAIMADQIEEALAINDALFDDPEAAIEVLMSMRNEADVLTLIEAYGTREDRGFGLPIWPDKNLAQLIKDELDTTEISQINRAYAADGINFKW